MQRQSLKKQAACMTASGVIVRAMGFFLRLLVSRMLGAEAVGMTELSATVHMLALTPAAAGLPGAVSRLVAKAEEDRDAQQRILFAGRQMVRRLSLWMIPLYVLLSPLIARWPGDERTLPSLLCFAPCLYLIDTSGVYDGYCLGKSNAWLPTASELGEQVVRLVLVKYGSLVLPRLTPAYRAALPAAAGMMGEAAGLWIVVRLAGKGKAFPNSPEIMHWKKQLWALSLPMVMNHLTQTGLRTLSSRMIPRLLIQGGLFANEAVSRLDMLNGMVMPLMFLPGLLAGFLAVIGEPAAARCKDQASLRRLCLRLVGAALLCGGMCAAGLSLASTPIACLLYRLPELAPLIAACCPMALILPLQQVITGLMTGLGMQKRTLPIR